MKINLHSRVILNLILIIFILIASSCSNASTPIDDENLYWDTEYEYLEYFDQYLPQRYSSSDNELRAARYIRDQLESFGYNAVISEFGFDLKDQHYDSQNVSARKRGLSSNKQIVIGAHYDSVQTSGITDNASGVALVLTYAKFLYNAVTDYDVEFVFFGSEELGMEGSKAYVRNMSDEEINRTIVMINADTLLAGTYRYIYGGTKNDYGFVTKSEGAYLAKKLSDEMGLGMRFNDTALSVYTPPTGVEHSDHVPFQNAGIMYIYFEATNWELPDDPNNPEKGSTGDYETEIGRVMHNSERDNLSFILNTFDTRASDNMKAYSRLLPRLVKEVSLSKNKSLISDLIIAIAGMLFLIFNSYKIKKS